MFPKLIYFTRRISKPLHFEADRKWKGKWYCQTCSPPQPLGWVWQPVWARALISQHQPRTHSSLLQALQWESQHWSMQKNTMRDVPWLPGKLIHYIDLPWSGQHSGLKDKWEKILHSYELAWEVGTLWLSFCQSLNLYPGEQVSSRNAAQQYQ